MFNWLAGQLPERVLVNVVILVPRDAAVDVPALSISQDKAGTIVTASREFRLDHHERRRGAGKHSPHPKVNVSVAPSCGTLGRSAGCRMNSWDSRPRFRGKSNLLSRMGLYTICTSCVAVPAAFVAVRDCFCTFRVAGVVTVG